MSDVFVLNSTKQRSTDKQSLTAGFRLWNVKPQPQTQQWDSAPNV